MMDSPKPSITIIGTGAVGSALENFFNDYGFKIMSTWNSREGSVFSDEKGEFQNFKRRLPQHDNEIGELVFITTPDDLISKIARNLSDCDISWKQKTVVHCSGNLNTDELSDLADRGAKTVSMHPIQTFKKGDRKDRFNNVYISLQGDPEAKEQLQPLIEKMGAVSISLDKTQKRILHIAAVMASNYLVALMFSAEKLLKDAGLENGFNSLETLVHQTISNVFEKGPENALTGPISRGDSESVQTHLKELRGKEQENVYKALGHEALKIAEKSGDLSHKQVDELKQLLNNEV